MRLLTLAMAAIAMAIPSSSFSKLMRFPRTHRIMPQKEKEITRMPKLTMSAGHAGGGEMAARFSTLRSIGVDYGLARTGIAVTTGGYNPRPLAILSRLNCTGLSAAVVDHVVSERATNVVLGLPLYKNGTESSQSAITRTFSQYLIQELRRRCGPDVHVVLWDEGYTSKEAATRVRAEAMARNERIPSSSDLEGELDADAACIILEDYYKELGEGAERVELSDTETARKCEDMYRKNTERQERLKVERMEKWERDRNARREMIERDRALEERDGAITRDASGSKKKKKKKKKR